MQQTLNFYEAILSHDHPAYIGVLRLALISAKAGTDLSLVKLYIVTLTFLPLNIFTCERSLSTEDLNLMHAHPTRLQHSSA